MTLKDKLTFLRENGITIKFLARATGLKASILYHFSSGKKLNEVKQEKLEKIMDALIDMLNNAEEQKTISYDDITGKKFHHLTAIKPVGPDKSGAMQWACQCDCGNPKLRITTATRLKKGETVSCGCLRKTYGQKNIKDLTGQQFGHLKVLRMSENKSSDNRIMWICECDCKNHTIKEIRGADLVSGKTRSCGCLTKSVGEENIERILIENKIPFKTQYSFQDLLSPKNKLLRYDFAIFNQNNQLIKLIEFDGEQHYDNSLHFNETQKEKEYRILCDKLKNNYAESHNIELIRIPYEKKDKISLEDLL